MVHRDLKPSNIMLTLDGLTLIDFGVARAAEQSQLTRTGMVVGTPAYMAPEQASGRGRPSGATDVFALGSVLAYAACGQPPFGDESGHGVLYRIVHEEPDLEPLRELEPELAELVAACLGKDPEGRPTATELLERASRHSPAATPPWPAAIAERLAERAAFAVNVQEIDVPTVPLTGGGPEPDEEPEPEGKKREKGPEKEPEKGPGAEPTPEVESLPEGPGARARRPERRRRTRVLLAVVPVVVVAGGTTLALQHLPYTTSPQAGARSTPSAPVTAPADPTASAAGGGPSGTASPAQSPAQDKAEGGGSDTGQGGAAGAPVAAAAGAGTAPGGGSASGGQNGAGGPGSSTIAGGTSATRPTGGGTTTAPTAPAPPESGTYRYRNGNNSKCITQVYGASDFGECSNPSARWTVQSRSDGSFKLVNQQSGGCLYSNGLGQAVFVGDCAQDIGRLWRTGSGGSLRSDYGGGCLDLGMAGGLVTKTCGGEASQRWTRQTEPSGGRDTPGSVIPADGRRQGEPRLVRRPVGASGRDRLGPPGDQPVGHRVRPVVGGVEAEVLLQLVPEELTELRPGGAAAQTLEQRAEHAVVLVPRQIRHADRIPLVEQVPQVVEQRPSPGRHLARMPPADGSRDRTGAASASKSSSLRSFP